MPVTNFLAGTDLTADALSYTVPVTAFKTVDQSVTSSTVLQNDSALFLPLLASQVYEIDMEGYWTPVNNSATPGLNMAFTAPSGATFVYRCIFPGATEIFTLTGSSGISAAQFGSFSVLSIHGICTMSSTAGNLQFQFAQNISSATSTTFKAGSFLTARRIG